MNPTSIKAGDHGTAPVRVRRVSWQEGADRASIHLIRTRVFVEEQGVPDSLDFDGSDEDPDCIHFLAADQAGTVLGTARLHEAEGRVGRMAVLGEHRGRGVGNALLRSIINHARNRDLTELWLHSQCEVMSFYEKFGFVPAGGEFIEADIPHRRMQLML